MKQNDLRPHETPFRRVLTMTLSFLLLLSVSLVPVCAAGTGETIIFTDPDIFKQVRYIRVIGPSQSGDGLGRHSVHWYKEEAQVEAFRKQFYSLTRVEDWEIDPEIWDGVRGYSITLMRSSGERVKTYRFNEAMLIEEDPRTGHAVKGYRLSESAKEILDIWREEEKEVMEFDPGDHFTDVPRDAWYYMSVEHAYGREYMSGVAEGLFAPGVTVTRGMLATILYKMEECPDFETKIEDIGSVFSDVSESDWYGKAVKWGYEKKLFAGYGGGKFAPNEPITREQFVTMFCNYAAFGGRDVGKYGEKTEKLTPFTDYSEISEWAKPAMNWAVNVGLIGGMTKESLAPKGQSTRAQCAAILWNWDGNDALHNPETPPKDLY